MSSCRRSRHWPHTSRPHQPKGLPARSVRSMEAPATVWSNNWTASAISCASSATPATIVRVSQPSWRKGHPSLRVNDSVPMTAAPLNLSSEVAVIGAGAMGAGIAQIAATAGHRTRIYDADPGIVQAAIGRIVSALEKLATKGRMTPDAAATAARRLQSASSLQECNSAGLVVEAIVENLDVQRTVLAEAEAVVGPECIIASNTSSISITAIGAALKRPQRLVGMHFFNPAPVMELVEIVSGLATDASVADKVYATAAVWG